MIEPPLVAINTARLLGYVSDAHLGPDLFDHSLWLCQTESVVEKQFSSLAEDSQLDIGLGHSNTLSFWFLNHFGSMLMVFALFDWKPAPKSQVSYMTEQLVF